MNEFFLTNSKKLIVVERIWPFSVQSIHPFSLSLSLSLSPGESRRFQVQLRVNHHHADGCWPALRLRRIFRVVCLANHRGQQPRRRRSWSKLGLLGQQSERRHPLHNLSQRVCRRQGQAQPGTLRNTECTAEQLGSPCSALFIESTSHSRTCCECCERRASTTVSRPHGNMTKGCLQDMPFSRLT